MSLMTVALINGVLAVGILAALAYVCRLPFGLDRPDADSPVEAASSEPGYQYEPFAA
jgi:hypothetical protein